MATTILRGYLEIIDDQPETKQQKHKKDSLFEYGMWIGEYDTVIFLVSLYSGLSLNNLNRYQLFDFSVYFTHKNQRAVLLLRMLI